MASSNTNSTSQVRVVLAPRDHTILGHLLLQSVFALTVFGGALDLKRKLDSAELPKYLYPRRGGGGGGGGHSGGGGSGGSRSRGSGGDGDHVEGLIYSQLIISVCFLLYNLVMIYRYLKNKMSLDGAIQWNVIFWMAFILSVAVTGLSAPQYAIFRSPPLAAIFLGAIFLV